MRKEKSRPGGENAEAATHPGMDGPSVADGTGTRETQVDLLSFSELLALLGYKDGEFVAVCHRPAGTKKFRSSVLAREHAAGHVDWLEGDSAEAEGQRGCVWFSVNPVKGPERYGQGRGTERDATRWGALYLDCDTGKEAAFRNVDQINRFVDTLSGFMGMYPSVVIFSGAFRQVSWPHLSSRILAPLVSVASFASVGGLAGA